MSYVSIPEYWPDRIVAVGAVRRIYYHVKIEMTPGVYEWHYFGTTAAEKPPTSAGTVFEHSYISFPVDFEELTDANDWFFQMGLQAGIHQQGIDA